MDGKPRDKLKDIGLGNYLRCKAYGPPINPELALEIIRRTDMFFNTIYPQKNIWVCNNNLQFERLVANVCKYPKDPVSEDGFNWREKWRYIETEFLNNQYISSRSRYYGWCKPDGNLSYDATYIKYTPQPELMYDEFCVLASSFPFIKQFNISFYSEDLISLRDQNEGFKEPHLSFMIDSGEVYIYNTPIDLCIEEEKRKYPKVGIDQIIKWSNQVYGIIQ